MTRVETYLNENLRKRLDQVEQVHFESFIPYSLDQKGHVNFKPNTFFLKSALRLVYGTVCVNSGCAD